LTKSTNIDELKQRTREFSQVWQKKLGYLSEYYARSGLDGAAHWLKSHHQIEDLETALHELVLASDDEEFSLLQVATTLSCFNLPEEDQGQAEWYQVAHNHLTEFEKELVENNQFDLKKLQAAQNELKFISQADEFHQRYSIQPIQQKASIVYQSLEQAIKEHKVIEKEKNQIKKDQDAIKVAEMEALKAQALAKKAMIDSVKVKEKRIAIIEQKKQKIAEIELLQAQEQKEFKDAELKSKQAEIERQYKLQDSYIELQLEEKIAGWDLNDLILSFTKKLQAENIDDEKTKELEAFIGFLNSKLAH